MASILDNITDPFDCKQLRTKSKTLKAFYEYLALSIIGGLAASLASTVVTYYSMMKTTTNTGNNFDWESAIHTICEDTSNIWSSLVTNIGRLVPAVNESCEKLQKAKADIQALKYKTITQIIAGFLTKIGITRIMNKDKKNIETNPTQEGLIRRIKSNIDKEVCDLAAVIEKTACFLTGTQYSSQLTLKNGKPYKKLKL